jgi:hypothetical protein
VLLCSHAIAIDPKMIDRRYSDTRTAVWASKKAIMFTDWKRLPVFNVQIASIQNFHLNERNAGTWQGQSEGTIQRSALSS